MLCLFTVSSMAAIRNFDIVFDTLNADWIHTRRKRVEGDSR